MKRISVFLSVLFLISAGKAPCEGFKADQSRFFSNVVQCVDVEISRFGSYVALADRTEGNSVRVYDERGELLWRFRQPLYWAGTYKKAGFLAFAPDESYLVFPAFRTEKDIALVNPKTGELLADLTGHGSYVNQVVLSPDGRTLVSSSSSEVFLWRDDGSGFRIMDRLPAETPAVTSAAFDSSGALVALAMTGNTVRRLEVLRVDSGSFKSVFSETKSENNLSREYQRVAFSPDGKWLAADYGDSVRIWKRDGDDFAPGPGIDRIDVGSVYSLAFSPDSVFLLTGHFRHVRAWTFDGGGWKEAATVTPHHGGIMDMAFSANGTKLALAGIADENGFGLWSVSGVGASPEGRLLGLLKGSISAAQKKILSPVLARRILSSVDAKDLEPRDMFETDDEFRRRMDRAGTAAARLFQEETESAYKAVKTPLAGTLYEVTVPLQARGAYEIGSKTYRLRFMETEATVGLDRDEARDLYRNWEKAGVRASRYDTPEGPAYADFRLLHPSNGKSYPIGLSQNPFTGETVDRYGVRIPSVSVGPDLLVRDLTLEGVFPSLYRSYEEKPLGRAAFQNSGSRAITKLRATFFLPGLMKAPTKLEMPDVLGVGKKTEAELRALIDPDILGRAEGGSVQAELSVEYESGGKAVHDTITRSVGLLNRNAIRWDDDKKVAAFMALNDPSLVRFSGNTASQQDTFPADFMTGEFLYAQWFFAALKETGVRYVVDPSSSYAVLSRERTAVDFLRFPAETLEAKAGDCDDLAVLFNTLLESVGVATAYITVPGHIFTAFNPGLDPKTAVLAFGRTEDFIVKEGKVWLPVETTMLTEGFVKAWQTGAREWKAAQAAGTAGFFETASAWKQYLPAGFSAKGAIPAPASAKLRTDLARELERWRDLALKPREKELLDLLAKGSSPARENRLGILYARFGVFDKALERFEKAGKDFVPALMNAGFLYWQRKDLSKAKELFLRVLDRDDKNFEALSALAEVYFESGEKTEADAALGKLRRIDPLRTGDTRQEKEKPRSAKRGIAAVDWLDDGSN